MKFALLQVNGRWQTWSDGTNFWIMNTIPWRNSLRTRMRNLHSCRQVSGHPHVRTIFFTKSSILWDITQCSPLKVKRRFGGTKSLPSSGSKNKPSRNQLCLPPAFTLVSCSAYFFDPENGGDMFLRKVSWFSTDYMVLYTKRHYSS
jgi:hypothetical protein